ncbi:UDP-galactose-lipid carrier transferase [Bacillus sp. 31A1R]|uniref:UDP-galactose-lipid carrier transferase n=1 Tax=Robertmurraya mangrovi TaxID=3098077 RepID=A0ABU5ITL4_9BACI|nr:UDP-galactose-lipid carrier transferase [Bacillus sp. 31A1R]MDZ5470478.1 UDP-galactose-lipid carrier transferase [Bacillus sp. 31A1R]
MLEQVDLDLKMENKKEYKQLLKESQLKLLTLQRTLVDNQIGCIIVTEGWDAAGKGGAIKRMTEKLDPRGLEVHAIAAPTADEKRYPYLHRFWTRIPKYGKIGIFDRSWYGRVLVERVEKFAKEEEWKRAYDEIIHFEKLLNDENYIIIKFWFHISKDEQLERFKEREDNPLKRWKITEEDWRNREKWDDYLVAVEEMLERTNTPYAPWVVVEGEDKKFARLKSIQTLVKQIEKHLEVKGIQIK